MSGSRLYRDEGVVLRTYRLGEADRIVVVFTRGHGKVRSVAKGVRKTTSKFGSRLEPLSHVDIQFHEGRELDKVTQVMSAEAFHGLRGNLDSLTAAMTVLEVVDGFTPEREPNPRLFQMLVGVLRTLDDAPAPLVLPAFLLKVLAAEGLGLEVGRCVACGATEGLVAVDLLAGGATCEGCRSGMGVSGDALALIRRITGGDLVAALNEPTSPAGAEVARLAISAVEQHLERRLRSLRTLG